MGMGRADAIAYLGVRLGTLLGDVGITVDESGLGAVVDDALLLLGTGYTDLSATTIADNGVIGYRAVLLYVALQAALVAASNRVNVSKSLSTPGVSKSESKSQIVDNLMKMVAIAEAKAGEFVTIGDLNSWQATGRFELDTYNKPYLGDLGGVDPGLGPI